ncbi:AraC family transcriptional regulator [Cohnella thermotolerans]|jgi:AraC-like DNA-binding protein|uniref:AraC family transcriptional regulator n=1 Tax=Cohnella thermotolerans TaxID=329858 RepID=UPI00042994D0|nr:AraC family transcriptional regulator [Cohnella thermotolerans]
MNRKLSEATPFVGEYMPYLYDGSANEKLRVCSVYAMHLFPDGPGEFEIEGIRYPIEKRSLFFLRPGQPHAFHISREHPLPSHNLYFDMWERDAPVSANRHFAHFPERLPPTVPLAAELPCDELDALPGAFSLQPYPWLYEAFLHIAKVFDESAYYRNEATNSLFYAWMLGWYNAIHTRRPSDYRIVRLLARLDEQQPDLREPVENWARICGLKRSYFHELFLRETGMTPHAYRQRLLMKRAAHLLRESALSVTAIAERLGYPSIHPFTRHFTAYHGMSPRAFRRNAPAAPHGMRK